MASRRNTIKKPTRKPLLPTSVTSFLVKFLIRIWGVMLILIFVAATLAFLSYDINDPSWNNVIDKTVANFLGLPGSYVSDLLIQSLGFSAYVLALPLFTWGWRIITLKGLPFIFMHLLILPLLVMAAAVTLSTLPIHNSWPLDNIGLGGFIGQMLLGYIQSAIAWGGVDFYPHIIAGFFGFLTFIFFFYTAGLEKGEWNAIYSCLLYTSPSPRD